MYLSRVDYGDLTLSFRGLFAEEADKEFGIKPTATPTQAKAKADEKLELLPKELTRPVITDVVLENIDTLTKREIFGETVAFDVSPDDIKRAYTAFAKVTSLPFAPVRSHTKIQQTFYDWFDKRLGYAGQSRIEIQRIVVCSEDNQRIFREIIERAKARFKAVRKREIEATERRKAYTWRAPIVDYYTDEYVPVPAKRAAVVSAANPRAVLLKEARSLPEQEFEKLLERPESPVAWWYKNGDRGETYFAIPYVDPETNLEASFYPDYRSTPTTSSGSSTVRSASTTRRTALREARQRPSPSLTRCRRTSARMQTCGCVAASYGRRQAAGASSRGPPTPSSRISGS